MILYDQVDITCGVTSDVIGIVSKINSTHQHLTDKNLQRGRLGKKGA